MRVKRGVAGHAKHKKIHAATKGMSHPNRVSVKRGKQAVTKSLQYAYRDRRNRKRTFRQLWNARINAAENDGSLTTLVRRNAKVLIRATDFFDPGGQ